MIGFNVGQSMSRHDTVYRRPVPSVEDCRDVRMDFKNQHGEVLQVDATLLETGPKDFQLKLDNGHVVQSAWSQVDRTSCKHPSYAVEGLLIGLGVDVVAIAALAIWISSLDPFHGLGD